jgi:NAD(P) transhydrogenase subunit alpha
MADATGNELFPITKLPSVMAEGLIAGLVVFTLASFVGFEVINKVPPTLHTPLMSGSNAISGIAVLGAILISGQGNVTVTSILGTIAIALATINVVGGFLVTDRMLQMFKKKEVKA